MPIKGSKKPLPKAREKRKSEIPQQTIKTKKAKIESSRKLNLDSDAVPKKIKKQKYGKGDCEDYENKKFKQESDENAEENDIEEMDYQEEESLTEDNSPEAIDKCAINSKTVETSNATKKELKLKRKMQKKNSEIAMPLMKMYTELNAKKTSQERRSALLDKVVTLTKGKVLEMVRAHDTVRVFECLLLHGQDSHKQFLFNELKDNIVDLAVSKYAKFIPIKMLTYGNKEQKLHIIESLKGKVTKLLKHKEASELVDLAYNDHANANQRAQILQELYGPHFVVFKSPNVKSLQDAIENNPNRKSLIMENLKSLLPVLIEKDLNKLSIVQHLLLEYLNQLSSNQSDDMQRMVDLLKERLVSMLHTREGVKVAMLIMWNSSARDRKIIIKSMKSAVCNVCLNEHGYLFILSLMDCVDDIVLLDKFIFKELAENSLQLAQNKHGRHVLLYTIVGRDPVYFNPQLVSLFSPGDTNRFTKKDRETREKQLKEYCSPILLKLVKEHFDELISENATILLLADTLIHCLEPTIGTSRSEAFEPLFTALRVAYQPGQDNSKCLIESPVGHILLKKLTSKSQIFRTEMIKHVPCATFRSWTGCNKGCFILLNLWESGEPSIKTFLANELKSSLSKLKTSEFPGAQLLYKVLS